MQQPTDLSFKLKQRVAKKLAVLDAKSLIRELPSEFVKSETQHSLASNDYLGLSQCKPLQKILSNLDIPYGFGSSRMLAGDDKGLSQVEIALSHVKQSEFSFLFPTGYQANIGLCQALSNIKESSLKDTAWIVDQKMHMSVRDGMMASGVSKKSIYRVDTCDFEQVEKIFEELSSSHKILMTESIFSMSGKRAPIDSLLKLCERNGDLLVVDEAHSIGCFGKRGEGLVSHDYHPLLITVNPCGKAVSLQGAFVSGPSWFRDVILNYSRSFIYSTGISPFMAKAIETTFEWIKENQSHLKSLSDVTRYFHDRCNLHYFGKDHIVYIPFQNTDLASQAKDKLRACGFETPLIRFPTVSINEPGLRVSLRGDMNQEFLDELIRVFNDCKI